MLFDLELRAKPIVKWAGGKSGPLLQLTKNFPRQFSRYFEPFLGGGAVFLALKPGVNSFLNDSNAELILLYEVLREGPEELVKALDRLAEKYSEAFFYELRDFTPQTAVEKAARTLFLNKTGYNGLFRLNSKGKFNVPYGKRDHCPALYEPKNLVAVSARLKKAQLSNDDFETLIDRSEKGDFVYCDPPYEPLSRTSTFNSYTATGFSKLEQERLKKACERALSRGVFVAVSNSSAPFIRELYQSWNCLPITARRAINSKGSSRGPVTEILAIYKK